MLVEGEKYNKNKKSIIALNGNNLFPSNRMKPTIKDICKTYIDIKKLTHIL